MTNGATPVPSSRSAQFIFVTLPSFLTPLRTGQTLRSYTARRVPIMTTRVQVGWLCCGAQISEPPRAVESRCGHAEGVANMWSRNTIGGSTPVLVFEETAAGFPVQQTAECVPTAVKLVRRRGAAQVSSSSELADILAAHGRAIWVAVALSLHGSQSTYLPLHLSSTLVSTYFRSITKVVPPPRPLGLLT